MRWAIWANICCSCTLRTQALTQKKSKTESSIIALIGYILLCVIGICGIPFVSIAAFFVINLILLTKLYEVKLKHALFYVLVLDVLSCIGEYIILYFIGIRYSTLVVEITPIEALCISVGGKILYLIGIQVLKRFINDEKENDGKTQLILTIVPVVSIVCMTMLMGTEMQYGYFIIISIAFFIINFVSFYINASMNEKNKELRQLQAEYNANKAELSEYELLAEKYEQTRIMRHDFHKQIEVLKELISADNEQAKEYVKEIEFSQRELSHAKYTDNNILNILLSQKVKEAHERGAEIHIQSTAPKLAYVSDIDTVAVFSNLLDNAIEAAVQTDKKEIFVDLYTVNKSYAAVKVENYTIAEPVIENGVLRTQKQNKAVHGMGIRSINRALKKYGSELSWSYDKEQSYFRAMVLIKIVS